MAFPSLKTPIARYYLIHLYTEAPLQDSPYTNLFAAFAETEYSQLLLTELSVYHEREIKKTLKVNGKSKIPLQLFETVETITLDLDPKSYLEFVALEYKDLPRDVVLADLSDELIECFEMIFLFLKGAIFPGIHKLEMLIDNGVPAMVPLREMLSRALPDNLKINILAEYQLMNFDRPSEDYIDFNLIWFLGKMDLQTVEKFMQEESLTEEEEETEESWKEEADSAGGEREETDRLIRLELEDELRKFYRDENRFFTRIVGLRHSGFDIAELKESTRVLLIPEPENPHDPCAVAVHTFDGRMIGYLKRELAGLMQDEIIKGIMYKATVAKILPEVEDTNSQISIVIEKILYHFN